MLPVFLLLPVHPLGLEPGVDCHWFHCPQQLLGDRSIDPRAAKGHTSGQTHHKVWLVATIYRSALRITGVGNAQPSPASPAGHDSRQECPAAPAGLCASGTTVIVEGELLLVTLVFRPVDVAFMMVLDHHLPCPDRLAMPVTPPCSAFDDGGAFLAFPVHVNARIKRVLENRDHVAVADRHPVEAGHAAFIGGAREVDLIGFHREQHLARAAELTEAGEDEPDYLLETQVWIEPKSDFAMPDVAERNRYSQLAPAGLLPGSVKHPRPQHAEFELADAAFHAQEKTIIGSTGIVDAVEINDASFDKPTQFEQVMPIAAIPGEPRRVEA